MEKIVASRTERVLERFIAPEVISKTGRCSILFIYVMAIILSVYGVTKIKSLFSMELFVTPEFVQYDFIQTKNEYMSHGWTPVTYVEVKENDFYSAGPQLQQLIFDDSLQRCETCSS